MNITTESLIKMRACEDAVEASRNLLPPKGVSQSKFLELIPRGDWLIWYLWNAKLANIEQVILLGLTAGRRSLRFANKSDLAVLTTAFDSAEAVVFNNCEETRSAARSAASAAWSAASAASAAWSAASAALSAERSAASAALSAERSAALSAAWSAESAALSAERSAASAAWSAESAEHKAGADAMRTLMRTKQYKELGRK